MQQRLCKIILVEDNPLDIALAKLALTETGIPYEVIVLEDGEQAIDFVAQQHAPPDLVLLDLNLPRRDGFEVLQAVRSAPEWLSTPVVVLSGSDAPIDMLRAYRSMANSYAVKSVDFEKAVDDLRSIVLKWWCSSQNASFEPGL